VLKTLSQTSTVSVTLSTNKMTALEASSDKVLIDSMQYIKTLSPPLVILRGVESYKGDNGVIIKFSMGDVIYEQFLVRNADGHNLNNVELVKGVLRKEGYSNASGTITVNTKNNKKIHHYAGEMKFAK